MPVTTTDLGTGVMNRQQANRFIQMVQEQAILLKKCRVMPVNHPKGQIDKIGVASRILGSLFPISSIKLNNHSDYSSKRTKFSSKV